MVQPGPPVLQAHQTPPPGRVDPLCGPDGPEETPVGLVGGRSAPIRWVLCVLWMCWWRTWSGWLLAGSLVPPLDVPLLDGPFKASVLQGVEKNGQVVVCRPYVGLGCIMYYYKVGRI